MVENVNETEEQRCERILREVIESKAYRDSTEEEKKETKALAAKIQFIQALAVQECDRFD